MPLFPNANTRQNTPHLIPEILQEAVAGAFAGAKVLSGSRAAVMATGLPGAVRGGDKIKIPYFDTIGELEDVEEGEALTPASLETTAEEAVVRRSGKAFASSHWAQLAAMPGSDPYQEAARQIVEAVQRRADQALIDVATDDLASSMILEAYNPNKPRILDYDLMVAGKMLWGDEQEDIALLAVHSATLGTLYRLKDSTGTPLLTPPTDDGLRRFAGVPVVVSDRMPRDGNQFTSLILKERSLAFWLNETPRVDNDKDILRDNVVTATNVYWVAHRYKRLPGKTKGGVVAIRHNVIGG